MEIKKIVTHIIILGIARNFMIFLIQKATDVLLLGMAKKCKWENPILRSHQLGLIRSKANSLGIRGKESLFQQDDKSSKIIPFLITPRTIFQGQASTVHKDKI